MIKLLKHKSVSVSLSVLSSVALVSLVAYATSIGTNVSVSGTLTTTGASTLTGDVTMSGAATVTGATTLNGAVTLGDAVGDTITVNGVIAGFVSNASSTVSTGVFNVGSATLGVATSTPRQELGVVGSAIFEESSGTTTLFTNSTGTGVGSCIQLRGTGGAMIRLYATTVPSTVPKIAYGHAAGLVVEGGVCQ